MTGSDCCRGAKKSVRYVKLHCLSKGAKLWASPHVPRKMLWSHMAPFAVCRMLSLHSLSIMREGMAKIVLILRYSLEPWEFGF